MNDLLMESRSCFCQIFFEVIERSGAQEPSQEILPSEELKPSKRVPEQKQAVKPTLRKLPPMKNVQEHMAFRRITYVRPKTPAVSVQPVCNSKMETAKTPNPLIFRYTKLGQVDLVRDLLGNGADPNQKHDRDGTPLQQAARIGNISLAQLLLDCGGDINMLPRPAKDCHRSRLEHLRSLPCLTDTQPLLCLTYELFSRMRLVRHYPTDHFAC